MSAIVVGAAMSSLTILYVHRLRDMRTISQFHTLRSIPLIRVRSRDWGFQSVSGQTQESH